MSAIRRKALLGICSLVVTVVGVLAEALPSTAVTTPGHASGAPPQGRSTDFLKRVEFTAPTHAANPVCQITLILLAEHDTDTPDDGGGNPSPGDVAA